MKSKPKSHKRDSYLELVRQFPLRPIRNEQALDRAIAVIDSLLDRDRLTRPEQDYLDVLADLVERYEEAAHPIRGVTDGEMLRFLLDQRDATQAEVARATGITESSVSDALGGKRRLTLAQTKKLAAYFSVAPAVFLPTKAKKTARPTHSRRKTSARAC
jgi:HTH-type transcriptional regulator/antitoxin HigA